MFYKLKSFGIKLLGGIEAGRPTTESFAEGGGKGGTALLKSQKALLPLIV